MPLHLRCCWLVYSLPGVIFILLVHAVLHGSAYLMYTCVFLPHGGHGFEYRPVSVWSGLPPWPVQFSRDSWSTVEVVMDPVAAGVWVVYQATVVLAAVCHLRAACTFGGSNFRQMRATHLARKGVPADKVAELTRVVDKAAAAEPVRGSRLKQATDGDMTAGTEVQRPVYCHVCKDYKPPRAHHCRHCKSCILRMDHHCIWINNCVHAFNQKFFLLFLMCIPLISIVQTFLIASSMASYLLRGPDVVQTGAIAQAYHSPPWVVLIELLLVSVGFGIFAFEFLKEQVTGIATNTTVVETHQLTKGRSLNFLDAVKLVLGSDFLLWCAPTAPRLKHVLDVDDPVFNDGSPVDLLPLGAEDELGPETLSENGSLDGADSECCSRSSDDDEAEPKKDR